MTYTLELTDNEVRRIRAAEERGVPVAPLLKALIAGLPEPEPATDARPVAGLRFRDIVAPLQEDFEATGMTDEELDDFIEAEVKAHRAEQRAKVNGDG